MNKTMGALFVLAAAVAWFLWPRNAYPSQPVHAAPVVTVAATPA